MKKSGNPVNKKTKAITREKGDTGKFDTEDEKIIYQAELKHYITAKESFCETLYSLYNIIWGQRSHLMQNKPKSIENYEEM